MLALVRMAKIVCLCVFVMNPSDHLSVSRRGDCVTLQKHHKHSLLMTSPLQTNLGGLSTLSCSTAGLPAVPHASWQVSHQSICCALSPVFYLNKLDGINRGIMWMCGGWPPACTNTIEKHRTAGGWTHNCGHSSTFSFLQPVVSFYMSQNDPRTNSSC